MEFGKVTDISRIHWDLPPDDPKNESRFVHTDQSTLYFGSPAWGARQWLGKIYPKGTPPEKFLHYYARNFNCIELNTTHYRIPTEVTAKEWCFDVPSHFHFCPKVTKEISHTQGGLKNADLLRAWTQFLEQLGNNLGPSFIQFHELFSYNDKASLFYFLEKWPSAFPLSLELRHPSWFREGIILPALADYLHQKNIGLVTLDVAGRREVLHSSLSAPWSFIRLIGNDLDPSDEQRLKMWANKISLWEKIGVKKNYLMLHQPDDHLTIEFSEMASMVFKEKGFRGVPEFTRTHHPAQGELF